MPFARPTLPDLISRVRADLHSRLTTSGPLLRRAVANVLAPVWAGAVHMLHGHLEWVFRQCFSDTADADQVLREAALYGLFPTAAEFAAGPVAVAGVDGSVIPAGEILKRADGGEYATEAEVTIAGGVGEVQVTAAIAGAAGNLEEGEPLTFDSPVPGVQSDATVAAPGITGGADQGSIENTRERLIQRKRYPPQGGSVTDYIAWTLAVPGVARAWVFRWEGGLGRVVVRFTVTGADPIPDAPKVAEVQAALEAQAPVTAEVEALAPVPWDQNFTISITPDTTPMRVAVTRELKDLIDREGAPGDGAGQGTILRSRMLIAIGGSGVDDFDLLYPVTDQVPALGQLPVMGVITWD